jgi:hypothetical protein
MLIMFNLLYYIIHNCVTLVEKIIHSLYNKIDEIENRKVSTY